MKKLLGLLLCAALICSTLAVSVVSVGAYNFATYLSDNFEGYTGERSPYVTQCASNSGSISISPYARAEGNTAVLATVAGDAIKVNNAPAFQWVINAHKGEFAAGGITLSADVMIDEFTANDNNKVFGIDVRNSGSAGWYYGGSNAGSFNTDGTVNGGGEYVMDKWYNIAITFNYIDHVYNTVLTDLESGEKTVLASGVGFKKDATNVSIVNFEFYCASKVAIDNITLKEAPVPAFYSPADGSSLDIDKINAQIALPEYITEASVYIDGEKAADITPVSGKVMYQISCEAKELGDHTLSLIAKDASGKVYADEREIKATSVVKQYIKDYNFSTAWNEYYIGVDLGGGVGGNSSHSYSHVKDGDNYYACFKNTAQSTDNLFMRYGIGSALTGQHRVYIRAKAMQTTEDMLVSLEGNTSITLFGSNGFIAGTESAYTADTWYDFDIDFDTTTKMYSIYKDGEFLTSGSLSSNAGITGVRVYMCSRNSANAEYGIDHLSLEKTSYVKNYGFGDTSTYYIGTSLNGGVGGYSCSYSRVQSGTNYSGKFVFNGRDIGNNPIFVRYASGNINGNYQILVRAKTMQTNEKLSLHLEGIKSFDVFGNNGFFAGTDVEYSVDTWYDIYVNLNTEDGTYDAYVGNTCISSGSFTKGTPFKAIRIYMYGNKNTAATYELDHLSLKSFETTPVSQKIVSVTDGAENNVIVTDSDAVRVYFDTALKADSVIIENVSATVGGEAAAISSVTYSAENNYAEIIFENNLPKCEELVIKFSKNLSTESGTIGYPYCVRAQTGVASVTEYGDIAISKTDSTVTAAVDVYFADASGNAMIAVAGYDGNKMTDISIMPYDLAYGKNVLSTSVENVTGTSFKAFVFGGDSAVKPLCVNAEY